MLIINPKSLSTPEYQKEVIDSMNGWLDLINDPRQLPNDACTEAINLVYTPRWFTKRPWLTCLPNEAFSSTVQVLAIAEFESVVYRAISGVGVQYHNGTTWVNTTCLPTGTMTAAQFAIGKAADYTGAVWMGVTAGTINSVSVSTPLTVNSLVGQYCWVYDTLWVPVWQSFITANTTTTIDIADLFDRIPINTDTVKIGTINNALIFTCGFNIYSIFSPTLYNQVSFTWDTGLSGLNSKSVEWRENRLYITFPGQVKYSNLWAANYFPNSSFISAWTQLEPCILTLWDHLVIYADDGKHYLYGTDPDTFQEVWKGIKSASLETMNRQTNIAIGNNTQFYLSNQWLEMLQIYDACTIADSVPVSNSIYMWNQFWSYSKLAVLDNRVYLFDSNPQFWLNPTTAWIYDIRQSLANQYSTWSTMTLPATVTAVWYSAESKKQYIAYGWAVAYFDNTVFTDWNWNFPCTFSAPYHVQKDLRRLKNYFKWNDQFWISWTGYVQVYQTVYETWVQTLLQTVNFTATDPVEVLLEIDTFLNIIAKNLRYTFKFYWNSTDTAWRVDSMFHQTMYNYLTEPI